jgi:hypothetical protein
MVKRKNSATREGQTRGDARTRSLHVLARMRRKGDSLAAAAREEHIDTRTVRKYLGPELKGFTEGRIQPTKTDRRIRKMLIPTEDGVTSASISGSKDASVLGMYMSAVGKYLTTGDTTALEQFEGQSIAGYPLITDAEMLTSLAHAGALQLDAIYALPESSS